MESLIKLSSRSGMKFIWNSDDKLKQHKHHKQRQSTTRRRTFVSRQDRALLEQQRLVAIEEQQTAWQEPLFQSVSLGQVSV